MYLPEILFSVVAFPTIPEKFFFIYMPSVYTSVVWKSEKKCDVLYIRSKPILRKGIRFRIYIVLPAINFFYIGEYSVVRESWIPIFEQIEAQLHYLDGDRLFVGKT